MLSQTMPGGSEKTRGKNEAETPGPGTYCM
jgi:hypothetical protein